MSRVDSIKINYYDALEKADKVSDLLFYLGALLSIGSLFVTRESNAQIYNLVMISFALGVLAIFISGLSIRLYFIPRAEDSRRGDFFGKAYDVSLSDERTEGYYNNDQREPYRRIAAQVMENSFFSKSITLRMLRFERVKVAVYVATWSLCLFWRDSDYGLILAISQAVFSEQLIAKYLRLEWLRSRCEETYKRIRSLMTAGSTGRKFNAQAAEICAFYETSKSNAAIIFPSALFAKMNGQLSHEWERIRLSLNI